MEKPRFKHFEKVIRGCPDCPAFQPRAGATYWICDETGVITENSPDEGEFPEDCPLPNFKGEDDETK